MSAEPHSLSGARLGSAMTGSPSTISLTFHYFRSYTSPTLSAFASSSLGKHSAQIIRKGLEVASYLYVKQQSFVGGLIFGQRVLLVLLIFKTQKSSNENKAIFLASIKNIVMVPVD